MKTDFFVNGLKGLASQSVECVIENLESPPGRHPSEKDLRLSNFYNSLTEEQRQDICAILEETANVTTFSILCLLDHVSFIEDSYDKTRFEIYAINGDNRILLNNSKEEELHNLYNDLVRA